MTSVGRSELHRALASFRRDRRASSAVEFALVATPFVFTLLAILQMGIYYMTQSSLDAGVIAEADALNSTFLTQATPTTPSVATLQSQIASKAGGMINAGTLLVDLQPFSSMTTASVPIGSNPPNLGSAGTCTAQMYCGGTVLALRAQSPVVSFAPMFGSALVVRSAVLLRRQGQ